MFQLSLQSMLVLLQISIRKVANISVSLNKLYLKPFLCGSLETPIEIDNGNVLCLQIMMLTLKLSLNALSLLSKQFRSNQSNCG